MRRILVLAALLVALPAGAVNVEYVAVREADNPPDTATNCNAQDCGSVPYDYAISKYEVTNDQYAEFLNAVAASDPLGLYNANMGSNATFGGITQSGSSGSYTYAAKAGFEDKPVVYVSFYDALRFANWLHNGEGSGETETGAYTLLGGTATPTNGTTVTRNPGAIAFLPSENEWYKAAYFDGTSFFDYPAGSDTQTTCAAPSGTTNSANCGDLVAALTDVGSYTGSASPYGTFDQGGNVIEWLDQPSFGGNRFSRGGSFSALAGDLAASGPDLLSGPSSSASYIGFRLARPVPEPAQVLLVLTGGLVLAVARRQRRA